MQILGVSVDPPDEGKKFLRRVTRDCQEDRPHIPLDPYPVRLLTDPDAKLIRAVGTANEGHRAGTIAAPVTYVVDSTGKINGTTPAKALRIAQAPSRWRKPRWPSLLAQNHRRIIPGKRKRKPRVVERGPIFGSRRDFQCTASPTLNSLTNWTSQNDEVLFPLLCAAPVVTKRSRIKAVF